MQKDFNLEFLDMPGRGLIAKIDIFGVEYSNEHGLEWPCENHVESFAKSASKDGGFTFRLHEDTYVKDNAILECNISCPMPMQTDQFQALDKILMDICNSVLKCEDIADADVEEIASHAAFTQRLHYYTVEGYRTQTSNDITFDILQVE